MDNNQPRCSRSYREHLLFRGIIANRSNSFKQSPKASIISSLENSERSAIARICSTKNFFVSLFIQHSPFCWSYFANCCSSSKIAHRSTAAVSGSFFSTLCSRSYRRSMRFCSNVMVMLLSVGLRRHYHPAAMYRCRKSQSGQTYPTGLVLMLTIHTRPQRVQAAVMTFAANPDTAADRPGLSAACARP